VEVVFPVIDSLLRQRVRQEILEAYLADNAKARVLQPNGDYERAAPRVSGRRRTAPVRFNAQEFLIALAEGNESLQDIPPLSPRLPRSRYRQRVEQV
jgi:polyphosphate kinase